ncbi:sigma-70 family RNA polymerase sigma factor [Actinoplanes sp. NPDC026670]|uniref:RNA polymerase sigma factor n=1 Tax=Actinoplanes sp. NPDC026670 TaxID=3154700 RepID=UPI0033C628C0
MGDDAADEERFDRLWREHAADVLAYARRRVDGEQADEVVAETFVIAWRRLGDVPEAARPWLFGVARKVAANLRRSERRRDALHFRLAEEQRTGVPEVADGLAGAALDELPADDRELLMLLAWDGLSRSEAAEALGCSRATAAVRLHRARQRLKATMKRLADDTADIADIRPVETRPADIPPAEARPSRIPPAEARPGGIPPVAAAPEARPGGIPPVAADRADSGRRVPGARSAETFPVTAPGGPR